MRRLLPILLLLLASCRTVYVPGPTVHDTLTVTRLDERLVAVHDSVYVERNADTLYVYRERVMWRDRLQTDTVHETVGVPYPVEVTVPAELTKWQETLMDLGKGFIGLSAGLLLLLLYNIFIKRRHA